MVKLTNKMPALQMRRITREEFAQILRDAVASGNLRSYVGYDLPLICHIKLIAGYTPAPSREPLQVEPGDVILYCGLDPHSKYVTYQYLIAEVPNEPR